ncbi:DNA polymerase delta, subunit 4-domain-containing protein [Lactarius vividus]|nr:DNA polymerase delta, subunit 4-domain-containing protein [Lactarius vividus]
MAPQRSNSAKARDPTRSSSLRQGTLSFASAKRSGSTSAKDNLKGKPAASSPSEPTTVTSIRIGGKRKYEPDAEPEHEKVKEVTEEVERERLNTEDPRWNKAYGLAQAKMGHIQPVHAKDQSPVHHILRIFDLSYEYGPCVGVTRMERWERASALGLDPPVEESPAVREILMTKEGSEDARLIQNALYDEV